MLQYRGMIHCRMHCRRYHLNPLTSAKPVTTNPQSLSIKLVDQEIFHIYLLLTNMSNSIERFLRKVELITVKLHCTSTCIPPACMCTTPVHVHHSTHAHALRTAEYHPPDSWRLNRLMEPRPQYFPSKSKFQNDAIPDAAMHGGNSRQSQTGSEASHREN